MQDFELFKKIFIRIFFNQTSDDYLRGFKRTIFCICWFLTLDLFRFAEKQIFKWLEEYFEIFQTKSELTSQFSNKNPI